MVTELFKIASRKYLQMFEKLSPHSQNRLMDWINKYVVDKYRNVAENAGYHSFNIKNLTGFPLGGRTDFPAGGPIRINIAPYKTFQKVYNLSNKGLTPYQISQRMRLNDPQQVSAITRGIKNIPQQNLENFYNTARSLILSHEFNEAAATPQVLQALGIPVKYKYNVVRLPSKYKDLFKQWGGFSTHNLWSVPIYDARAVKLYPQNHPYIEAYKSIIGPTRQKEFNAIIKRISQLRHLHDRLSPPLQKIINDYRMTGKVPSFWEAAPLISERDITILNPEMMGDITKIRNRAFRQALDRHFDKLKQRWINRTSERLAQQSSEEDSLLDLLLKSLKSKGLKPKDSATIERMRKLLGE
jgi:hypothetical protein